MKLTNFLQLPNVIKKKLYSNGVLVEWAKDGRRMISYPQNHNYCKKLGINQVEIYAGQYNGEKTITFFRNGYPQYQGYCLYSPREKAINPNGNGIIGNLDKLMSDLANKLYSK